MRGLTEAEREALASVACETDTDIMEDDEPAIAVREALIAQGRVVYTETPDDPDYNGRWDATPAGREALALDAALRAMGVAI